MTDESDEALARQAADGDGEAFGRLVARHAAAARRVARGVLANGDDADDAVQDAFLSAWQAIGSFDPARTLRPWLMRIVVNAARDLARRRRVRATEPIPDAAESRLDSPERRTDRALLRARLSAALATLPERRRLAVVMFDAEGYSHAEIAAVLGVAEGTVRADVFHARRALRAALGDLEGGTA